MEGKSPPMPAPLTHVPMYSTGNGPSLADMPPGRKKLDSLKNMVYPTPMLHAKSVDFVVLFLAAVKLQKNPLNKT